MSMWTHIVGAIHIETGMQYDKKELKRELDEMLNYEAPQITGSEYDCQMDIVIEQGYDLWVSKDCYHCPHHYADKEDADDFLEEPCEAPADFECPSGSYQTRAIITLCGDLRDRTIKQTQKEVQAFIDWLKENFSIRNMSIKLEGETEEIIQW